MSAARVLRRIHYWTSVPLFVTIFFIAVTGSLLAVKKDVVALQAPTRAGSAPGDLRRPIGDLVTAVADLPNREGTSWTDVDRIDLRPSDGVAKVILHDRTEVQVDLATAKVLQVSYRTSDVIEAIHDFSLLGSWAKYVFSLGSGLAIIGMAATGVYLFWLPLSAQRKKRQKRARSGQAERPHFADAEHP